jgi:hypothetical protein
MRKSNEPVKILFLGQCLNYGYEGVDKSDTYADLSASLLPLQFPGVRFKFDYKYFYHPRGLKALLKHRVTLTRPDIVVINLPAMFAARPWRVNSLYEIAPELVDTARSFFQKIESRIKGQPAWKEQTVLLDRAFTRHPPIAIDEYERLIEGSVNYCLANSDCRLVLMGPGRFNEDTIENYPIHSPQLWSSVNEMVRQLSERLGVTYIDVQDALSAHGGEVFISENHRWSAYGHELVAREVQTVLASEIKRLSAAGYPALIDLVK